MTWLWARLHRARAVFDAHEDLVAQVSTKPYLPELTRPLVRVLARGLVVAANHGMDAVIAATDDVAAGFAHPRTVVVRNYPWLKDYPPVEARPVPGRVAYVGDLTEERRLSFMIEVVRRARQSRPQVHLVLAGRPLGSAPSVLDAVARARAGRASRPAAARRSAVGAGQRLRRVDLPGPAAQLHQVTADQAVRVHGLRGPLPGERLPVLAPGVRAVGRGPVHRLHRRRRGRCGLVEMLDDAEARARMGRNGRQAIERGLNFEAQARP